MSELELTENQKALILKEWNSRLQNPPSLLKLTNIAFPDRKVDGRSKEGRAIKSFLASQDLKARGSHVYKAKDKIKLTEDQEEFIKNHVENMGANDISRIIFKNNELIPLSQETRTVNEYIKTLDLDTFQDPEDIPNSDYKPPKTFDRAFFRINKYLNNVLDKKQLSPKQNKDIKALIGYLNTYRFCHQINSYSTETSRELFESCFIRYTYDKHDLTQEEVDQYIVLSAEVVIASTIQRRVERLQELLDAAAEDSDGRRLAMSMVEAISSAQTEYNQCINRQTKLLSDLKEKRSDKLKKAISANASILNLVEVWKSEEGRKKLIKLAELRKEVVKEEVDRLTSMDEIKARILGLNEGDVFGD